MCNFTRHAFHPPRLFECHHRRARVHVQKESEKALHCTNAIAHPVARWRHLAGLPARADATATAPACRICRTLSRVQDVAGVCQDSQDTYISASTHTPAKSHRTPARCSKRDVREVQRRCTCAISGLRTSPQADHAQTFSHAKGPPPVFSVFSCLAIEPSTRWDRRSQYMYVLYGIPGAKTERFTAPFAPGASHQHMYSTPSRAVKPTNSPGTKGGWGAPKHPVSTRRQKVERANPRPDTDTRLEAAA
ncbi:hypothetical protein BD414DRAFT_168939 [Trametes punicea]|nr:hypothetical protein BD414DRAFT_168939 [Trametes punicea]